MTVRATHLGNWRETPHSRWAFRNVRELIPTANISAGENVNRLPINTYDLNNIRFNGFADKPCTLTDMLIASETDAFLVMHDGQIAFEWYADHYSGIEPHVVFSVSKSITGLLTGILVNKDIINPELSIEHYLPETAKCGYGECTVQHILDMTAGIEFDESYLDTTGQYAKYRVATGWNPAAAESPAMGLHEFLLTLGRNNISHGHTFQYLSPNSDLLGWVLERAANQPYAELLSRQLWQPVGAETDAYITVDRYGAARSAGGICITLRDLGRVGELMRLYGRSNGQQVVPKLWIDDTLHNGDPVAWQRGNFSHLFTNGRYRNKWYQTGNDHNAFCAIGIHGQWIYVDPIAAVTIVKLSSQTLPIDDGLDSSTLNAFHQIACEFV